jgi:NAD(P)-dependent dehydrogenase (short-subunit alcohol dehydrogenase family)
MAHDFTGRRVLVTGGATGIGYATAEAFLHSGAKVAICDRNTEALGEAVSRLGGGAVGIECDLADSASITRCVGETLEKLGGIDVLVNNAGIGEARALVDCDDAFIDAILGVNLRGVMLITREAVRVMKGRAAGTSSTSPHLRSSARRRIRRTIRRARRASSGSRSRWPPSWRPRSA